ncbi:cupin domain-containing protein [Pontibacter sp. MBLB2868]|uniref:cupin domain-containing protein n=1 Tax=Pontibacter sp. MBLB2868 TaxID=3451555 RepID=UPI003F74B72F
MEKVNLAQKFDHIPDYWNPRIAGELNGQQVKLAKFKGAFEWHHHEHEDEFFLVVKGKFEMHLRDKVIELKPGEFLIVPRGVEHKPVANEEAEVLMFEPAGTVNTGNLENSERTRTNLERL